MSTICTLTLRSHSQVQVEGTLEEVLKTLGRAAGVSGAPARLAKITLAHSEKRALIASDDVVLVIESTE